MYMIINLLPLMVTFLAIVTKRKIVNAQSGKKYAYREMLVDIVKMLIALVIAIIANRLYGKDVKIWSFLIDLFMLLVYLLPLLQKNYNYVERKALMGIWSFFVFLIPVEIAIFQMLTGTYDKQNTTLAFCFLKGVLYLLLSIWYCFTTDDQGEKNKIKLLIRGLKNTFKEHKLATLDYYMLAFLELFIFVGANGYLVPVGIFGLHEIVNKRVLKGIIFILVGNACLFLQYKIPFWGEVVFVVYIVVALVDMVVHYIKHKNNK